MAAMPTVKTLKRGTVVHTACVHCKAQLEYLPPPASSSPPDEPFTLECAQCGQTWINRPQKPRPQGKRRIGSGARTPLSLSLSLSALTAMRPLWHRLTQLSLLSQQTRGPWRQSTTTCASRLSQCPSEC